MKMYHDLDWAILKLEDVEMLIEDDEIRQLVIDVLDLLYEHDRKIRKE